MGHKRLVIFLLALFFAKEAFSFCFEKAGALYGINPALLRAIAWVESNMNQRAVNYNLNGTKDVGVMQINSFWKERINWCLVENNPCYNVMVGAWILRMCADQYGYNWNAVVCYYTGKPLKALRGETRKKAIRYVKRVHEALKRTSILRTSS